MPKFFGDDDADRRGIPTDWQRDLTILDLQVIESLNPEVRAVVERYVRAGGSTGSDARLENGYSADYRRGWEDALDEVEAEVVRPYEPWKRAARRVG